MRREQCSERAICATVSRWYSRLHTIQNLKSDTESIGVLEQHAVRGENTGNSFAIEDIAEMITRFARDAIEYTRSNLLSY